MIAEQVSGPESGAIGASQIVDNPLAPELFVNEAVGLLCVNGNVFITFATVNADHSDGYKPVRRLVNLRLALPLRAAYDLSEQLFAYTKKNGACPEGEVAQ